MTHYSRAISKEDLTKEAFWLCDAIKERGGEVGEELVFLL